MASRQRRVRSLNPFDRYLEVCEEVTNFLQEHLLQYFN